MTLHKEYWQLSCVLDYEVHGQLEVDHAKSDEDILPPILGLNVIVEFHLCYTQPVKPEWGQCGRII